VMSLVLPLQAPASDNANIFPKLRFDFLKQWKENYNGAMKGPVLNKVANTAWMNSGDRAKIIAAMSSSERSKRRL
jgi:hypothetical protein